MRARALIALDAIRSDKCQPRRLGCHDAPSPVVEHPKETLREQGQDSSCGRSERCRWSLSKIAASKLPPRGKLEPGPDLSIRGNSQRHGNIEGEVPARHFRDNDADELILSYSLPREHALRRGVEHLSF